MTESNPGLVILLGSRMKQNDSPLGWIQISKLLYLIKAQSRTLILGSTPVSDLTFLFFFYVCVVIQKQPEEEEEEEAAEQEQEVEDGKKLGATPTRSTTLCVFCATRRWTSLTAMCPPAQKRSQRALRTSHQRSWTCSDWRRSRRKSCALRALGRPSYPTPTAT